MASIRKYKQPKDQGPVKLTRRELLLATTAAALAACSPGIPTSSAAPSSGASASSAPVRGGVVRLPIFNEPLPFNTVLTHEGAATTVMSVLFSQLTRIDPQSKRPVADLATNFEVSTDGLSWVFQLNNKAKWHDGQAVTADDVIFTFAEVAKASNASPLRGQFANIKQVEKVDTNTVRFVLSAPLMSFPVLLAVSNSFGMLPKHVLEGKDLTKATEFNNQRPIGSGPFKMTSVVGGSHVELTANEDFYRGRPNIDSVVFRIVPDANVRVAQLKSGELHWDIIDSASMPAVQSDRNLKVMEIPTVESNFFQINYRLELFKDKRLRQALIYALDRQAMMTAAAGGRGQLMAGTIPPAVTFWHNADLKPYPFDAAKAKSLLAEAGWTPGSDGILTKGGQKLSFKFTFDSTGEFKKQLSVLAQQYWKAIGVQADLQEIDRAVYSKELMEGTFGVTMTNRRTPQWDPDVQNRFYVTNGGSNFGKYSNPKVDELLIAAAKEVSVDKRKALYREYDQVIFDDAHVIHGYFPNELSVNNVKLKGLPEVPGLDKLYYIDSWYLEK
jgi:peptide/nickel transport system substrate-binding protein